MRLKHCFWIVGLCCLCQPLPAFESELRAMLNLAPAARELALRQSKNSLAARLQELKAWPSLYLNAPQAYRLTLSPESGQAAAAELGVQAALPFGMAMDLSWVHQLVYTPLQADGSNQARVGFRQPLALGLKLSLPFRFSPYVSGPSKIATSLHQLGQADYEFGINQLVDRFVQAWFSLYRMQEQLRLSKVKRDVLNERRNLLRAQLESGGIALHVFWESERQLRSAEVLVMQREHEYAGMRHQFLLDYGTEFPEQAHLPDEAFGFDSFGIVPAQAASQKRADQERLLLEQRTRSRLSASSPALQLSAVFSGSLPDKPGGFKESFTANFKDPADWKPVVSLGFSLASRDLGSASIERQELSLDASLLNLSQSSVLLNARLRFQQLVALREQYASYLEKQQHSLTEVEQYYADMLGQFDRGAVDALDISSVALLLAELRVEGLILYAQWLELVLRCRLAA